MRRFGPERLLGSLQRALAISVGRQRGEASFERRGEGGVAIAPILAPDELRGLRPRPVDASRRGGRLQAKAFAERRDDGFRLPGALLWGVAMGVFSLFPAIGTGLVWVPVTIYLLATGSIWQGSVLFLCGFFIISSVDNLVRPILVGRDARMPDYVVLVATLGGFELMGFNGFVIGPVIAAMFLAVFEILDRIREARPIG